MEALDTDVLIVSFESMERVRWYLEDAGFGWPVLPDPERRVYRDYGMGRASVARAWLSPRTVWFYVRSALRGRIPRRPEADALQLGGDVVIDRRGIVRYVHRSAEPADRPSVDRLLSVLRRSS